MSNMRIGGLATGMDIDQLVKDLMNANRLPVNKLYQQKQTLEWQRTAYQEMRSTISDYRDNKLSNYRLESTWLAKSVNVTNGTAVSAKATANSQNANLSIEVLDLATAATNKSSGKITSAAFDPSKTLGSQDAYMAGSFTKTGALYDTYEFKINGATIKVDPNVDSLDAVIKRINENPDTGVTAFHDRVTGMMSFTAKNTGTVNGAGKNEALITFEDTVGNFLSKALLINTANGTEGTKARVIINGLETTRDSNNFSINGIEITLNQKSNGIVSQLSVQTDTDKIVETVKNFIKDYNDLLKTVQDKVGEPRYRDFPPLSAEQKADMKDKEIELWEEKAKSGLLKNDSILSEAVTNLRSISIGQVENGSAYKTLSSIGIKTGVYSENGKLYLSESDEAKLREAIETDPQAIVSLFAGKGNGDKDVSDVGLAQRLYNDLKASVDQINKKAGFPSQLDNSTRDSSLLGERLYTLNREIDAKEDRLRDIEARYYRQFTAMEMAINRFNQQSMYLANAFGGGQ